MPRARCSSSIENPPSPPRATTRPAGVSSSTSMESAEHSPTPGATRVALRPSATSTSARSSAGSVGNPIDTYTSPWRTSAATSASRASAARSTASLLAVRSSAADDTMARKPVSCWVDQLGGAGPVWSGRLASGIALSGSDGRALNTSTSLQRT